MGLTEQRRRIDEKIDIATKSLVGHTITSARYHDPSISEEWISEEWKDHGEFELVLDDGRRIAFTSWGYTASQVYMNIDGVCVARY